MVLPTPFAGVGHGLAAIYNWPLIVIVGKYFWSISFLREHPHTILGLTNSILTECADWRWRVVHDHCVCSVVRNDVTNPITIISCVNFPTVWISCKKKKNSVCVYKLPTKAYQTRSRQVGEPKFALKVPPRRYEGTAGACFRPLDLTYFRFSLIDF